MRINPLKKQSLLLIMSTVIGVNTAQANINNDLKSYFDGLGFSANTTSAQAYKGQQAGYYTGGSFVGRNTVRNVQIASVKLPSYSSSCAQIDLHAGAVSFVSGDEMVGVMRSVMSNSGTYAFNLMLESATPQISNVVNRMTDMANKVNQTNINSCESAAALVGGVWPKTQVAQRHVCADIGINKGVFSDYAAARQGCGKKGEMSQTLKAGAQDEQYQSLILDNANFAWKAIMKNNFLKSDTELAELFMSLSGSIIINKEGEGDKATNGFHYLPPLAMSKDLMKAMLEGGQMSIYKCDNHEVDGCLLPVKQTVTIRPENGLQARVKKILDDMVLKIYNDTELTQDEMGFLNATQLPVYKMLNVQAAYSQSASILDVSHYANAIAADLLFQYLHESLMVVSASAGSLQAPQEILSQFQTGVREAVQSVRAAQDNIYQQMNMTMKMVEETQAVEQILAGQLSTELASTLAWSRSTH